MLGLALSPVSGNRPAPWWPNGALYAADFTGWRFMRAGQGVPAAEALSFSRASAKLAPDLAGTWLSFAADVPAVTDRGLLLEPARTNAIRNSAGSGALPGTPGTLPTNWTRFVGGGLAASVGTSGMERGLPFVDLALSGTSNSANGTQISFDSPTGIAAASGQTWTQSIFLSLPAGTLANISFIRINLIEVAPGGSALGTLYGSNIRDSLTATPQRFSETQTLVQPGTAYVRPVIEIAYGNAANIAMTLRVAGGQMELGSAATSPILTNGSALTRAEDIMVLTHPLSSFDATAVLDTGATASLAGHNQNEPLPLGWLNGGMLRTLTS
ncbi:phage head spike fiber domain-containing protein [Devosia aquimaris]|uniref:phage head spike fiber domain-containing protein n=1 Tax=Devosia aquimaris TaxID=2866214 RepID=UPI001CD124E7|nr:hypothetical protein [Devosia sp. CJK-A8-3]